MKRGCEHASRTKRRRSLTMPSYKTYKKSSLQKVYLCEKSVFAGNLYLQEIYLCEKSISARNLSLQEICLRRHCMQTILKKLIKIMYQLI